MGTASPSIPGGTTPKPQSPSTRYRSTSSTIPLYHSQSSVLGVEAGPLHGLALELYVEENQYTTEITQNVGMKVVIHDQDRVPFPEDEGSARLWQ